MADEIPVRPKVLVTGADGQLGLEFRALEFVCPDLEFTFLGKVDFDITLESRVHDHLMRERPDAVINCAAYTNVERAEDDRENAFLVNARAAGFLARACNDAGSLLVHFSTDYVFDGRKGRPYTESDAVSPLSVYGASKLEGEREIDEHVRRHLIFRVSWLYSTFRHNFYRTMIRLAKENGELRVVNDQVASPTYARYLAHDVLEWLERILVGKEHVEYGVYHYAQSGQASWFEFAREIASNRFPGVPVVPVQTSEFPTRAVRPAYSKLDASRFIKASGITPATWKEALSACIQNDILENG